MVGHGAFTAKNAVVGLLGGNGVLNASNAPPSSSEDTPSDGNNVLHHYTTEEGQKGILESETLNPSLKANNPKDARYGDGQYLTDIKPGTMSPNKLSQVLVNNRFQGNKFTHYVSINVKGLNVTMGRDAVYVVRNNVALSLKGRIVGSGSIIPKK